MNSASVGYRQYSPFANWTFREFNEYPHLLQKRLNLSYENANKYLNQFSKPHVVILAKFISFFSGSVLSILLLITLFEEEMQQGFEIAFGMTALFYISFFGGLLALAGAFIPVHNYVFEPEKWMRLIVLDTHYSPPEWRNNLHTEAVNFKLVKN